jgi:CHAT domain-containing protein
MTQPTADALFAAITEQFARSQQAFAALLSPPPDVAARVAAQRAYREAATQLLELERRHNETGFAPMPWDLELTAQPLVQQTMIEADLVDALGRPGDADALREGALAIAQAHLSAGPLGRLMRERGTLLALDGRFNEALTQLADVRRQFAERGDVLQAAQTALDEAAVLEWLGDHERALTAIQEAAVLAAPRLAERTPGTADIAGALVREASSIFGGAGATGASDEAAALWRISVELVEHEARVRKALGELDAAERLFTQVLGAYRALGETAGIEYQLVAIDADRGRFEDAQARLTKIEPAFEGGMLRARRIGLRSLQADVRLGFGAPEQALALTDDGIADLAEFPDDDLAWKLNWKRARSLAALERPDDALAAYEQAAAIVDSLRKAPLGYRLDSTYLESKLPLFDAAIDLAEARGAGAACARFVELVKARALSSALSIPAAQRGDRTELELEFDRVTRRLDALEFQGYRGSTTADMHRERGELLQRRIALMEQIRLRDPRWRGLTESAPFDPSALSALLAERGQAALTLYVRDDRVVAVLFEGGAIEVASQPLAAATRATIDEYARNLLKWRPDPFLLDPADFGFEAGALIPPALLERALGAGALLVAPHRSLHLLPWPALLHDGRRLFERTAVGVIPNLTAAATLYGAPDAAPRAALLGVSDYGDMPGLAELPGSGGELDGLDELYRGRLLAPLVTGPAATEAALRTLAGRDDAGGAILHVACHGTLAVDEPLNSGLLVVDGKLDAAELADTRIRFDEVVLSACSTGWRPQSAQGIELRGDDILGLPGALLEAGARSVVVSIPKADDQATRTFMLAYHGRRAAGAPPLAAFRATQEELLSAGGHAPYTWSGLVCYSCR